MATKKDMINALKNKEKEKELAKYADKAESEYGENTGTVTTKSLNIKTVPDALSYAKVDTKVWEVERHIINFWDVTIGSTKTNTGKPETYTNYQIKIWLKRIVIKDIELGIKTLLSRYKPLPKVSHSYFVNNDASKIDKHMAEISLYDHHFGMLAWAKESGTSYDVKIATTRYKNAIKDLLCKISGYKIEKILFPVGQDFFHINDNTNLTPAAKNQLDSEGRLARIFEYGIESVIQSIEMCRTIAPVEIKYVPGNHDHETAFFLCQVLKYAFLKDDNVEVDVSPLSRKFVKYGITLLGLTHGQEPWPSLPLIMADESPQLWADTQHHLWHVGHFHKRKEMKFVSKDNLGSVLIECLPSLAGTDHWHYMRGFVGGNRAADCHLYSEIDGPVGRVTANLKKEDM